MIRYYPYRTILFVGLIVVTHLGPLTESIASELNESDQQKIIAVLGNQLADVTVRDLEKMTIIYKKLPGFDLFLQDLVSDDTQKTVTRERATVWLGVTKDKTNAGFLLEHFKALMAMSSSKKVDTNVSDQSTLVAQDIEVLIGATIIGMARAGQPELAPELIKIGSPEYWADCIFSASAIRGFQRLAFEALAESGSDEAVKFFAEKKNRPGEIESVDSWNERLKRAQLSRELAVTTAINSQE